MIREKPTNAANAEVGRENHFEASERCETETKSELELR